MTTYLIECFWPGVNELQLGEVVEQLQAESTKERSGVAWMRFILVPDDEIVLCLATSPSAEAIRTASQRACLPAERIVTCVQVSPSRKDERRRSLGATT